MNKVSPSSAILEYVASRSLPVTRQEIISGTMLSKDQVRKATNDMVLRGRLATELDEMGVTYYMTAEANMKAVEEFAVPEQVAAEIGDPLVKSLIRGAEQHGYDKGFSRGYASGVQEAQREAYELGKKSVITKLGALLA